MPEPIPSGAEPEQPAGRFQDALGRLGEATARLMAQNRQYELALEHMSHGVVMVDREDRILLCSSRFRQFYCLAPDEAKPGMTMAEVITRSIAAGGHPWLSELEIATYRAETLARREPFYFESLLPSGRILGLYTGAIEGGGVVTVFADVTQRRLGESALREQNAFFDGALANMSQGLCMFDAQGRLVVHNRRYLDLFDLPAGAVRPGMAQREIVELLVARGCYGETTAVDEILRSGQPDIAAGAGGPVLRHLASGRVVAASYNPIGGGGWVATFEDVTERQRSEARIAHMASHDALTDLPNRTFLRELLGLAARSAGTEQVAVFFMDLDRFKSVNDTLGHHIGDGLLQQVAGRLRAELLPGETAARLGGDEFALLKLGGSHSELAARAAEIIRALSRPYRVAGYAVDVGISVGVAPVASGDGDLDRVLQEADVALYRAKAEGRGRFRLYEAAMDAEARARSQLEVELREAVTAGNFELHYQPLLRLETGTVTGFEALVRWRHAEHGLVAPSQFIALAEETGLVSRLGEWVLRRACADAAGWPEDIGVAVNISAAQMRDPGFALLVMAIVAECGLNPCRLELEITETVLLDDSDTTLAALHQLRRAGIRIALDDFGTGYSSLSYLRRFPFDKIKIDRSFVGEVMSSSDSAAIIRAICGLGASLGIATLAEGVETLEQLEAVRAEGCTLAQGYLISPPRPLAEALVLIDRERARAAA